MELSAASRFMAQSSSKSSASSTDLRASVCSSSTRSKLSVLQERISGFEKELECEAQLRKKNEDSRLSATRDALIILEKTLNTEVKRRVDGNRMLQQVFEEQITEVQDKLETIFVTKLDQLQVSVDSLNERMGVVEQEFEHEKKEHGREIEEKHLAVVKDVTALQGSFESEKASRQEREAEIAKRLGDIEDRAANQFEIDRNCREQKYEDLRQELEMVKSQRERSDENFQRVVLERVGALKDELLAESQIRESADDDIVQAINHYTKALQDALRLVNNT